MVANLIEDLKVVDKELKALSKKVEQLIAAIRKVKHPETPKKSATKKTTAKKTIRKVPAGKTANKATIASASDTVLALIKRSKKGLDNAALIEKTGYDKIKVRNIVFRLKKLKKIKTASRGIFLKA